MNQKIILSGVLTLALISTGCSTQASTQGKASSQTTTESQTSTKSETTTSENKGTTIGKYGKVKKIVGNSVTIALAEIPKGRSKTADASGTKSTTTEEGPPEGAPPTGEPPTGGGAPPSESGSGSGSGGSSTSGGNGGPPSGGGSGGGATGGSNGMKGGFGLSAEELDLTGEVVELMIPVGVKITSASTSGMKEIDFADIAQGDTIALYYVKDTENIERVVITPSSTN